MLRTRELLVIVLVAALGLRLGAMALFPLTDTTEARYGEIARLMLETGDWIMPQFDYGVPFWAKPPLAFWLEAAAFGLFGVSEFAGRLPSLLATLATVACLYAYTRDRWSRRVGLWAAAMFATSAVAYVNAGAILTDPFLTFGTTLAMVSLAAAMENPRSRWRYGFFVGLAVGLLAKGPIALILIGGPLVAWATIAKQWPALWRVLPWVRGALITAALALPWYVAAELRSPGFLEYFLVGEHFRRFVDGGWQGDLYGSAHRRLPGTIWVYWLGASFPWGIVALRRLAPELWNSSRRRGLAVSAMDSQTAYLLSWALFPMVFFTFAGNILWTYVLPAMPALALLLAISIPAEPAATDRSRRLIARCAWIAPVLLAGFVAFAHFEPTAINSEKYLVQAYIQQRRGSSPLVYVEDRPFSARFYSAGQAQVTTLQDLMADGATPPQTQFVAVPNHLRTAFEGHFAQAGDTGSASRRFHLYELVP